MKKDEDVLRILKIENCKTLSGTSTLTYHISCDESSAVYFRVYKNTGGGFFSQEWIALKDIEAGNY